MRTSLLFAVFVYCALSLNAQDRFPVTRLTFDPDPIGFATWSPDGKTIVYSRIARSDTSTKTGLWKISPDGKDAKQFYFALAEHPKWSPDGRWIVFDADSGMSMKMIRAEGGAPTSFLPDSIGILRGGMPCWSPDGTRIAVLEGVERVFRQESLVPMPGCWTSDGKAILIALLDRSTRKSTLLRISSDGKERTQIQGHHEGLYRHLALSPDGSLLVYAALEGRYLGLWIMPAEGGKSIPLAVTQPGHNEAASWSPDGKKIAFNSARPAGGGIWIMEVDINQLKMELQTKEEP
jgi:Tol biopolymer transport system component